MELIPDNIIQLAAEATAPQNDGLATKQARKKLKAIKDYIEQILAKNPVID